jgi:hypothetical protein
MKRATTTTSNDCDPTSSGENSNGQDGADNQSVPLSPIQVKQMAHAICAGLAFAVLFPIGAIVFRLFSFPGLIWVHAGIQIVTNILFFVGFGLGISLANEIGVPVGKFIEDVIEANVL